MYSNYIYYAFQIIVYAPLQKLPNQLPKSDCINLKNKTILLMNRHILLNPLANKNFNTNSHLV